MGILRLNPPLCNWSHPSHSPSPSGAGRMLSSPTLPVYVQQNTWKSFPYSLLLIFLLFRSLTLSNQAFLFSILPELFVQVIHGCHVIGTQILVEEMNEWILWWWGSPNRKVTHVYMCTNRHTHTHTEGKGEREGERRMERELFLAPDPAKPDLALSLWVASFILRAGYG